MHCHLIVDRKDQSNEKKLSPLTNHKNTPKERITGGFDRITLFQQAEQSFDKLFSYNCQQIRSFDYQNTMKNGSIVKQLKLHEYEIQSNKRKTEVNLSGSKKNRFLSILQTRKRMIAKISKHLTHLYPFFHLE